MINSGIKFDFRWNLPYNSLNMAVISPATQKANKQTKKNY